MKNMMKKTVALLLGLSFLLGGCAQSAPEPSPAPETPPENAAEVLPQPVADGKADYRDLALKLAELNAPGGEESCDETEALTPAFASYTLRTARKLLEGTETENTVYSPANLYLALCMLAETTDGASRAQLLGLLGLESVGQARTAASSLYKELYRDSETGRTLLANSIWLNERFGFKQDTVDRLASDYLASAFRAPMGNPATDQAIAEWINENTNHLLEKAAGGLQTSPETLMVLISTLYFKGTWREQFNEAGTAPDTFTDAKGEAHTVDFMHITDDRSVYYRGERFTVASLPFMDGTRMWFLLPDEGVSVQDALLGVGSPFAEADPAAALETVYGKVLASEERADIRWSMPKFDVSSDLDLIPTLKALGVTDIFGGDADFTPLTDLDAFISAAKHAARVKVDEEGCEAAAFTEMSICTTALPEPMPVIEMDLDRPFGFLITGAYGLPLFLGVVNSVE